jgi:Flp pilus assembly CpaF family ATPase
MMFRLEIRNRQTGEVLGFHLLREGSYLLSGASATRTSVAPVGATERTKLLACPALSANAELRLRIRGEVAHMSYRNSHSTAKIVAAGRAERLDELIVEWRPANVSGENLWQSIMETIHRLGRTQTLTESEFHQFIEFFAACHDLEEEDTRLAARRCQAHLLGLGPLEELLADPKISEVLVNGTSPIVFEKQGRLTQSASHFHSLDELQFTCEKLALFMGRPFSMLQPICEGVWRGGERIEMVHRVLAPEGPLLSIRRQLPFHHSLETWLEQNCITEPEFHELVRAVRERKTLLIAGTTGSGKTTLLQALTHYIGQAERWISIEDTPEIFPRHCGHVRLLTRTDNQDGHGEVTMASLIKCSLRLRPDRFVIGEVRGAEALYLIQALSTGHAGSLGTIHARSVEEARTRMVLMAGMHPQAPRTELLYQLVDQVIDGIVVVARDDNGHRHLTDWKLFQKLPAVVPSFGAFPLDARNLKTHAIVAGPQDAVR